MFERFSERSRRVLFFARDEASQLGSMSIDTEHLLLGLIPEGKGLTRTVGHRDELIDLLRDQAGVSITREQHDTPTLVPRRR